MIKAPSSGMPRWASSIMTAMRRGSSPEGRRSSLGALQRDEIRASLASAYNAGDRPPPVCRLGRYGLGGSRPWISVGAEWPASNLRWRASSQYNHLEALATFLIKGAVVWYAAVRTQWQLCQGNMLLDAMVCFANILEGTPPLGGQRRRLGRFHALVLDHLLK